MDDAAILDLCRKPDAPHAAAVILLAVRELDRGGMALSVDAIVRLSGLARSHVYRMRHYLDEHAPGWRTDIALAREEPAAAEPVDDIAPVDDAEEAVAVVRAALAVEGTTWRHALAAAAGRRQGRRSWDLYADVYAPAADVLFASDGPDDLIALTVDYLEAVTAEEATTDERKRLAKLVRQHGKAALYGLHEAVNRTDVQSVDQYVRYALAVAKNIAVRINHREATT